MTKSNKPLPSLDELQRKIDKSKPEGDEEESSTAATRQSAKTQSARAMRAGTDILAGSGVGCVMGYYLDEALGTLPFFFILLFFLGFAAGVRNIMRNV